MTLPELNALPADAAERALLDCCGARAWTRAMTEARPYRDEAALHAQADAAWDALGRADRLEAFAAHPRIGERARAAAAARHAGWSAQEQAGVDAADARVTAELAELNRAYEARFGHVFLICATGRSAAEMLASLRERMTNDAETELDIAAEEQRKIMHLRLEKLLRS